MSQTNAQKAQQIIGALDLPEGHYAVQRYGAELVGQAVVAQPVLKGREVKPVVDMWMNIYMSTAVWFKLYESTDVGIVWTLCLPDPNNPRTRCNPPVLEYELMGITIRAMYSAETDSNAAGNLSDAIAKAEKIDGIPVID